MAFGLLYDFLNGQCIDAHNYSLITTSVPTLMKKTERAMSPSAYTLLLPRMSLSSVNGTTGMSPKIKCKKLILRVFGKSLLKA